jgi:hypothetical protein
MSFTNKLNIPINIFTMIISNGWSEPSDIIIDSGHTITLPTSDSGEYVISSASGEQVGKLYVPVHKWFGSPCFSTYDNQYNIVMDKGNCFAIM